MKKHFQALSSAKHIDALTQFGTFLISIILCICYQSIEYLMILAPIQILSCIIWTVYFISSGKLQTLTGKGIRLSFWIIMLIVFLTSYKPELIIIVLWAMIIIGPIMGILYFIITIMEMKYYSIARKPYYLL